MGKIDMKDTSFLIPVRLDSIERIENLLLVIDFLMRNLDTSIYLLEAAKLNNGILRKVLPKEIQIEFVQDFDPIFHRTRYINVMAKKITTPYYAIWDADVIVPCGQLMESIQMLRDDHADFVYPYRDFFLDVPEIIKEYFHETGDIHVLSRNTGKMEKMYYPNPVGGAFLVNRKAYFEVGLENENFYGWGIEDGERYNRWTTLAYRIKRVTGVLYHFTHKRSINSQFHDEKQNNIKTTELYRIGLMSKKELEIEVKTWNKGV